MEYQAIRTRAGATLELDEYRLEATSPTISKGNITTALAVYNGSIAFTDNVNLTSSRSRSTFLKKLAERDMAVDEAALMALEQACRVSPVSPVSDSRGKEEGEYKGPSGAELLSSVESFLARFVSYPSVAALIAHVLWIVHTHLMDCWDSTPRIAFLSPEPGSGKTRGLEVSELLVPNPVETVNMSAAALFRKVADESGLPTVLFDEVDTVFGSKHKAEQNEDVRGLLNAGHRRGAKSYRCVTHGKEIVVTEYEAYCAVALAGLGDLPDTLLSRSVIIHMRRRAPNERVEPFRRRLEVSNGHKLRDKLAAWARSVEGTIGNPWPDMPDGIEDRNADVWEALLAVADAAGGEWPVRARKAAIELTTEATTTPASLGIRLLEDLRTVFGNANALHTEHILERLNGLDEAPWAQIRNNGRDPLNALGLSQRVRHYGVKSKQVRVADVSKKGYLCEDFADAWNRYLSPIPEKPETPETQPGIPSNDAANRVSDADSQAATETKHRNTAETKTPSNHADVSPVSLVSGFQAMGSEPQEARPVHGRRDIDGELAALNEKLAAARTLHPDAPWDCYNCGKTNYQRDACKECGAPRWAERNEVAL